MALRFYENNSDISLAQVTATHSGGIHADETFAMAVFSILDGDDLIIYRTRDEDEIAQCKRAIDVGRVHDPDNDRFDHHQIGFSGVHPTGIQKASAGLVWEKYGISVIQKLYPHTGHQDAQVIADVICHKLAMSLGGLDTVSIQFTKAPPGLTIAPTLIETMLNRSTEQLEGEARFEANVLAFRRLLTLFVQVLVERSAPADLNRAVCNFLSSYDEATGTRNRSAKMVILRQSGIPVGTAGRLWRKVAKQFLSTEFLSPGDMGTLSFSELATAIDKDIITQFDALEAEMLLPHTATVKAGEGPILEILSSHDHLSLFLQCDDSEGFNTTLRDWFIGKLLKTLRQNQIESLVDETYLATENPQILVFREIWPDRNKLLRILRRKYPEVLVVVYGVTGEGWRTVIPDQNLFLFPEEWIGDNPDVRIDGVKIADITFIHTARFFAAVQTLETAELIARELVRRFMQ